LPDIVGEGVVRPAADGALVGVVCAFTIVAYPRRNIERIEKK
jgi:hypothetical protein